MNRTCGGGGALADRAHAPSEVAADTAAGIAARAAEVEHFWPEDYEALLALDETVPPRPSQLMPSVLVDCFPSAKVDDAWKRVVCMSGDIDDAAFALPCGHCFHTKCAKVWLSEHRGVCPCCHEPADPEFAQAKRKHPASATECTGTKRCLGNAPSGAVLGLQGRAAESSATPPQSLSGGEEQVKLLATVSA